jgi:hypothetical protein
VEEGGGAGDGKEEPGAMQIKRVSLCSYHWGHQQTNTARKVYLMSEEERRRRPVHRGLARAAIISMLQQLHAHESPPVRYFKIYHDISVNHHELSL